MSTQEFKSLDSIDRQFTFWLTAWFGGVAAAGYFGLFTALPIQTLPLWVVAGIAIPLAIYFRSDVFRHYINSIALKHLTLFHLWRIPAGFAFLWYGSQGVLPEAFVHNAGYGDLAVGFLVPLVLLSPGKKMKLYVVPCVWHARLCARCRHRAYVRADERPANGKHRHLSLGDDPFVRRLRHRITQHHDA